MSSIGLASDSREEVCIKTVGFNMNPPAKGVVGQMMGVVGRKPMQSYPFIEKHVVQRPTITAIVLHLGTVLQTSTA